MKNRKISLIITSVLLMFSCSTELFISYSFKRASASPIPIAKRIEQYDAYSKKLADDSQKIDRKELENFVADVKKIDSGGEGMIQGMSDMHIDLAWLLISVLLVHLITVYRYLTFKDKS